MRKVTFIISIILHSLILHAQNFVPNPSFELYTCPLKEDRDWIDYIKCWKNPIKNYTPDAYIQSCPDGDVYECFLKYTQPRTGVSSIGILSLQNTDYREYVQINLPKPLQAKHQYYGYFYVGNHEILTRHTFIWDLGMHFSKGIPKQTLYDGNGGSNSFVVYEQIPQIRNNKGNFLVNKKKEWVKIEGKFVAQGNENYLTLGSFSPLSKLEYYEDSKPEGYLFCAWIYGARIASYYLIDDVALYDCTQLTDYKYFSLECQPTVRLAPEIEGGAFLWSDGSTAREKTFDKAGKYWLESRLEDCFTRDTFEIFEKIPQIKIDTLLCEGTSLVMDWAELITDQPITEPCGAQIPRIEQAGDYKLDLKLQGCTVQHDIKIRYEKMPEVRLARDTVLCRGEVLRLQVPDKQGISYEWSNGDRGGITEIRETGVYSLVTQTKTCYRVDEIKATFYDCLEFLPNVITPNGDGLNETFFIKAIRQDTWFLQIYNRWGDKVFESENYQNDWNAEGQSGGLYYYQLRNLNSKKDYKGWVQVMK